MTVCPDERNPALLRDDVPGEAFYCSSRAAAAADCERKYEHIAAGQRRGLDKDGSLAENRNRSVVNILPSALAGGAAGGYGQAVGSLLQAIEREMNAALALRQARAELSILMEAIWPDFEDQDAAAHPAGASAFPPPPVLSATLDELEARYRSARAAGEEARRQKRAAIEEFLHARTGRSRKLNIPVTTD